MFATTDFETLRELLPRHPRLLTTPPVLAEASNLMGNTFHEDVAQTLVDTCAPMLEIVHPKEQIFGREGFGRLGFADASILSAASDETVVLTDDVHLYNQVLYEGNAAINFNHLRKFGR